MKTSVILYWAKVGVDAALRDLTVAHAAAHSDYVRNALDEQGKKLQELSLEINELAAMNWEAIL